MQDMRPVSTDPEIDPGPLLPHLFRISRALAGRLDFLSAIQSVAQEIERFLPYDHLDLCLLRHDGNVSAAYETGIETAWGRHGTGDVHRSPIRELLLGRVGHMLTADATRDPRFAFPGAFKEPIHDHNLRARVHVPLEVGGEIIGGLSISSFRAGVYGPHDVAAARYVADLISPYVFALREAERSRQAAIVEAEARAREEGLRLGARDLTQALEQERQRIGMDLHDQTLADLSRLMRDLSRPDAPAADAVLARLDGCVADLRRIIDTAVPSILEMFGFAHAVRVHLERATRDGTLIHVQDDSDGAPDRLDPVARIALYRIVQEAINNAGRHARASRIDVRIARQPRLRVTVADDGCGLSEDIRRSRKKGGLSHMRTRAQLIGARLSVRSGRTGTSVSVSLPTEQP
ncbi:GAF domain-containing sensor histidine kinase [Paracoccus laeviglucosivorans]|uniref:Histidine kinase-, DNA gyrase B-, and HSP90-like ATPase n=1 Tax=Paracoccus laeviglucosivorans TaxID=1197861 RepID=A0A521F707_9RHOB|nr:sensor histidine kinase [Paracoccus laeviglucosivorans]SMO91401.1 Histidine kinase-, DNA gyrase B-, and HSP90-like ATPase [Paracoccus laeviglucosivorans]